MAKQDRSTKQNSSSQAKIAQIDWFFTSAWYWPMIERPLWRPWTLLRTDRARGSSAGDIQVHPNAKDGHPLMTQVLRHSSSVAFLLTYPASQFERIHWRNALSQSEYGIVRASASIALRFSTQMLILKMAKAGQAALGDGVLMTWWRISRYYQRVCDKDASASKNHFGLARESDEGTQSWSVAPCLRCIVAYTCWSQKEYIKDTCEIVRALSCRILSVHAEVTQQSSQGQRHEVYYHTKQTGKTDV